MIIKRSTKTEYFVCMSWTLELEMQIEQDLRFWWKFDLMEEQETSSWCPRLSFRLDCQVMTHGCCELPWLKILLENWVLSKKTQLSYTARVVLQHYILPIIMCINYHEQTKRIEVMCHFIRDKVEEKDKVGICKHWQSDCSFFLLSQWLRDHQVRFCPC